MPMFAPPSSGSVTLLVLDLPTLIEVKTAVGRARDRLVLPLLIALLDRQGG